MIFEVFAWILTPLVPALVALYFLKLKRREIVVSSTFLWKRSVEDLHVNSPFQRLRRSLLLLLQLLVLLALIFAASRPMISGSGIEGKTRIILVDNSASMNVALGTKTRLERAVELARILVGGRAEREDGEDQAEDSELVVDVGENDRACLIVFSDRADLLQSLTSDRAKLRAALAKVEPSSRPTDFLAAIETAASIAQSATDAEIYVLSDGAFPELAKSDQKLERLRLRFVRVGVPSANLGITEIEVRRDFTSQQKAELFASVRNASEEARRTTLGLYEGDNLLDAAALEIAPGANATHSFSVDEHAGKVLRAELSEGGSLADDDRAWVRVDPPREIELLIVGSQDWFLEKLIQVRAFYRARRVSLPVYEEMVARGELAVDPADIVIFNRAAPVVAPDRPALYIGAYPDVAELRPAAEMRDEAGDSQPGELPAKDGDGADAGGDVKPRGIVEVENPYIIDWDRVHPINSFITFGDLVVTKSYRFDDTPRYASLLESEKGSIAGTLILTPTGRPPVPVVILGFGISNTNWPWLASFPMFFSNALDWLGSAGRLGAGIVTRTGQALVARSAASDDAVATFSSPSGETFEIAPNRDGELALSGVAEIGVWKLEQGEAEPRLFPVALLNQRESDVSPGESIRIGADSEAEATEVEATQDLWKWFAMVGLAFLLFEWWVYNRRMTI